MLQAHWSPLSLSPGRFCLIAVTSVCKPPPPNKSLDWLFIDFHLKCYPDGKILEGSYLISLPLPCLIFFLAQILFCLLIYAVTIVQFHEDRFFLGSFFLNSVYTEKAVKYLTEWLNSGLAIVSLGLPFVLCLMLLIIIVIPVFPCYLWYSRDDKKMRMMICFIVIKNNYNL